MLKKMLLGLFVTLCIVATAQAGSGTVVKDYRVPYHFDHILQYLMDNKERFVDIGAGKSEITSMYGTRLGVRSYTNILFWRIATDMQFKTNIQLTDNYMKVYTYQVGSSRRMVKNTSIKLELWYINPTQSHIRVTAHANIGFKLLPSSKRMRRILSSGVDEFVAQIKREIIDGRRNRTR